MPDLNRWPEADTILEQALVLPPGRRRAFVGQAAGGDRALEHALIAVLEEDERADDFLAPGGALDGALFDDLCGEDESVAEPTLEAGVMLGPYRVDRPIGRGGMGEVYRARDLRLGRDVALKILPRRLAGDPDRLARLQREARALASISHPGIGGIFDVYEQAGTVALVLELVEGPTLAERLAAGAIPLPQVLAIARQLVDAIEAAHERGIVHRDLKPANVKIAPDGTVKILDFGLARAVSDDEAGPGDAPLPSITTSHHPGVVMGTASYMSPEQARGQRVDHRTDIWAFGCLLYEMITGQRAFGGATTSDIFAKLLERDPDFDRVPPSTPLPIVHLIRRCVQKDPRRRLGYIGDARFELEDGVLAAAGAAARSSPRRHGRVHPLWALAAIAVAGGAVAVVAVPRLWPSTPAPALRLAVPLPPDHELVVGQLPALEMSRDVDVVVYRARQAGTMRLYARALDQAEPTPVPASEDAVGHAVSPDGRWVAFGRDGHLFKALLSGGPPVKLGAAPGGVSVAWAPDHTIVYSTASDRSLLRLPESGGAPVTLVTVDDARGEQSVSSPDVSADGTIAYTVAFRDRTAIAVTGPEGGAGQVLTEGRQPRFVAPDLLVFARQQSLWAARYDARRRALASEPALVLDGVERSTLNSHVHYTVGAGGSLLYIPARGPKGQQSLMWRDRRGGDLDVELRGKGFVRFALSPDSSRIALAVAEGDDRDIWILERARKALSRLTLDPSPESAPLWSPDGTKVAYRHDGDGGGIMLQAADGSRAPTQLTRGAGVVHIPYSFTPDGRQLLFVEFRDYRMQNVHVVSIDDPARVTPVLVGPGAKTRPAVSPDGRWLAYQSDESGRSEVYVRPWPDVERARWQVSTSGGTSPVWRRDGRELFFAAGDTIMAASVEVSRAFRTRLAEALFPLGKPPERLGALFDVSPDGMRFLVVRDPAAETGSAAPETRLVTNWARVLRPQLDAR